MRSSWLYFAIRSVREAEPVLICPAPVATARSAMNGSSVSPERCDTTAVYPARAAIAIASSVSVSVPIWLTLIRIELATPSSMPRLKMEGLVTKRSSPTSWILSPTVSVSSFQPAQSFSDMPSSMDTMAGYWRTQLAQNSTICSEVRALLSDFLNTYLPSWKYSLDAGSSQMPIWAPGW